MDILILVLIACIVIFFTAHVTRMAIETTSEYSRRSQQQIIDLIEDLEDSRDRRDVAMERMIAAHDASYMAMHDETSDIIRVQLEHSSTILSTLKEISAQQAYLLEIGMAGGYAEYTRINRAKDAEYKQSSISSRANDRVLAKKQREEAERG